MCAFLCIALTVLAKDSDVSDDLLGNWAHDCVEF